MNEGLANHIKELQKKHKLLDEQIIESYRFHGSDELIKKYKVEKLKIKTEIDTLQSKLKAG